VEARGDPEGALLADLAHDGLHVVQLRPRGRTIVPADRPDPHRRVAEDEGDVHRNLVVERRQLARHGEPVGLDARRAVETGVELDVAIAILCGLERGMRVAVDADELGGDALAHLGLVAWLAQDGQARVGVHVDEARRHDVPGGIDAPRCLQRAGIASEDTDGVALHAHRRVEAGVAAAVDHEAVTDEQIEHGSLLWVRRVHTRPALSTSSFTRRSTVRAIARNSGLPRSRGRGRSTRTMSLIRPGRAVITTISSAR